MNGSSLFVRNYLISWLAQGSSGRRVTRVNFSSYKSVLRLPHPEALSKILAPVGFLLIQNLQWRSSRPRDNRGPGLKTNFFWPFVGPQFGLKIRGGGLAPRAPLLDPPLIYSTARNSCRIFNCLNELLPFFPLFLFQLRAESCVPQRMEVIKKAILERDFRTFAETTMKVHSTNFFPLFPFFIQ